MPGNAPILATAHLQSTQKNIFLAARAQFDNAAMAAGGPRHSARAGNAENRSNWTVSG
jgi:hypothetical protein